MKHVIMLTGNGKPNRNNLVIREHERVERLNPSFEEPHAADHHRQTQAHGDSRAVAGITKEPTGKRAMRSMR